jgi:hypothetical protein
LTARYDGGSPREEALLVNWETTAETICAMLQDRFPHNWKLVLEYNRKSFTTEHILAVNPCLRPLILRILTTVVFIYKEHKYPIIVDVDQPMSDIVKVLSRGIDILADSLEILFGSSVLDGDISLVNLDCDELAFIVNVIYIAEELLRSGFKSSPDLRTISQNQSRTVKRVRTVCGRRELLITEYGNVDEHFMM